MVLNNYKKKINSNSSMMWTGNISQCTDDEIRLFAGPNPRDGRVQVCLAGQCVTVCREGWRRRKWPANS